MDQPKTWPEEQVLSQLLYQTFAYDLAFNPNNSLLLEMINFGSLKDLSSPRLRQALTNWIATTEDIKLQENDLEQQCARVLDMFRGSSLSLKTLLHHADVLESEMGIQAPLEEKSNLSLFSNQAFENNLLIFLSSTMATEKAHYLPLLEELDAIISLLEQEMGN